MPDSETLTTRSIGKGGIYSRNFEQEGRTAEGNERNMQLVRGFISFLHEGVSRGDSNSILVLEFSANSTREHVWVD